jgi:hypothetical protein
MGRLAPTAEVIPVSKSATKSTHKATVVGRGGVMPFDEERYKRTFKREFLTMLLEYSLTGTTETV